MFVGLKCPLDRELQGIEVKLEPMKRRNKFERFLKATDDDADIREFLTQAEQAIYNYQVQSTRHMAYNGY